MFKWLEARRDRIETERFVKSVPSILEAYGEIVAKYPAAYIDESMLPVPKPMMQLALQVGWSLAKSKEQREWLKVGWVLLSSFQKGVGKTPISSKLPPGVSPEEAMKILEPFLRFSKIGEAESIINVAEMERFIAQNSK